MRILVIRTIQFALMERLLKELAARYPAAKVSILTNLQQLERVQGLEHVEHTFGVQQMRDYSVTNIGLKNIFRIRKCKFDMVVVPHMQAGFGGFGNILLLLPLLGVRDWFHCSADWQLVAIEKSGLWTLVAKAALTVFLFIPSAVLVVVGFLYILFRQNRVEPLPPSKRWYAGYGDIN